MARKRTELGAGVEAEIRARLARGDSAVAIHAALEAAGHRLSRQTVDRRVREMRAGTSPPSSGTLPAAGSVPAQRLTVDTLPQSEEDAERLLASGKSLAEAIEEVQDTVADEAAGGNLERLGKAARALDLLTKIQQRTAPLPKQDPNDSPDMRAMAAEASKRLHKMIDQVRGK